MADVLTVWTVYKNPDDYPRKWVLRAHDIGPAGTRPRAECIVRDSLEEIRAEVPPGLYRLNRAGADEPAIFESWV